MRHGFNRDLIERRKQQLTETAEAAGYGLDDRNVGDRSWTARRGPTAVHVEFTALGAVGYASLGNRRAGGRNKFSQVLAFLAAPPTALVPASVATSLTPTAREAAHALWAYGWPGGVTPGEFVARLLDAFKAADFGNHRQLAEGFPGYGAAMQLAKYSDDGMAALTAILVDAGWIVP